MKKISGEYDETEAATLAGANVIISSDNVYFDAVILATAAIVCLFVERNRKKARSKCNYVCFFGVT